MAQCDAISGHCSYHYGVHEDVLYCLVWCEPGMGLTANAVWAARIGFAVGAAAVFDNRNFRKNWLIIKVNRSNKSCNH
jgi:hypothetical protein